MNDMLVGNTWFEHKEIHKYTRVVTSRNEKSIIDLILIEKAEKSKLIDVRVKRGSEIGSDHYLVEAQLKHNISEKKENNKMNIEMNYTNIKTYRLQEEKFRKRYKEECDKRLLLGKQGGKKDLEELWKYFKDTIKQVATEICGVSKSTNKRKQTPWWNQEIKEEVRKKKKLWKKYLGTGKNANDYEVYKQQREKVKVLIREAKKGAWKKFG